MRNVIVTGGSRGLGLAIAKGLAVLGYQAIAIARTATEEITDAVAMKGAAAGAIAFRAFDLADTAAIGGLVSALKKDFGPIYGLINNAAIGTSGVLSTMRVEQIENLVQLNVLSPIILTRYVLRSMMVARAGRIINVSSVVAATGYSGLSVYSATKASLVGFTRSLAREVGSLGITVNAVAPGFVDTQMTGELSPEERDRITRRSALKRMIQVDDVVAAVGFLMGETGRNITGTTLTVDAGNTA